MKYPFSFRLSISLISAVVVVVGLMAPEVAEGQGTRSQALQGHVPAATARLAPVGLLDRTKRLRLAIGLPPRNQAGLQQFLKDLYDPKSLNFRKYLTPAQFAERFGPTAADYAAVAAFASAHHLTVTERHPNRLILDIEAAVPDIETAFHVRMRTYQHPTEARQFFAPDAEPSLDLATPVLHISGLDDYARPHPNLVRKQAGAANATPNTGSSPSGSYAGGDFRAAYVPGTSLTGAGQTVGLLQFDGFYANDIAAYASQFGIPSIPLTVVPIDGGVS
ncbi:MAG TPA: protease pro-enzyme activation domain-containing protein, partial [Chthoniobacteraceae bacterium]